MEHRCDAPCPRCMALDAQVAEVLPQLRASPTLPPALRMPPPERLAILVRWAIIVATNPRPRPQAPHTHHRHHRRPLDMLVEDLGGVAASVPSAGADADEELDGEGAGGESG